MVGSYPRPQWFKQQLLGRDIRVAFKEVQHEEVYNDAVATVIRDQEEAGLDIVTDGNMWYDDYVGVIGSFCWYLYERIDGFEAAKEEHPSTVGVVRAQRDAGDAPRLGRRREQRPGRQQQTSDFADLYRIAAKSADDADQGFRRRRLRQPRLARATSSTTRMRRS